MEAGAQPYGGVTHYSGQMSSGLMIATDGIAGSWQPTPYLTDEQLKMDGEAHMGLWAPWVRSFLLKQEVLSRLYLKSIPGTTDDETPASLIVYHLQEDPPVPDHNDELGDFKAHSLIQMTRPTISDFQRQLDRVRDYADLRGDRFNEIHSQVGYPVPYFGTIVALHPERNRYTLEFLALTLAIASIISMRTKHAMACRRPDQLSAQVQPIIPTPGHGTLPGAHSVEAFVIVEVLSSILKLRPNDQRRKFMLRQAARISDNRVIAGVHYPVDSIAGALLGQTLGEYICARAGVEREGYAANVHIAAFNGPGVGARDFSLREMVETDHRLPSYGQRKSDPNGHLFEVDTGLPPIEPSMPLKWLFDLAQAEWSVS
ncbi:phosphatase PAP2 family protein [Roseibium sp.]|uniref:phosphatase PAP2 family protein n=1 Tax=Roseibium sp. TaxID=1936156 RepID=UPI00391BAABF